MEVAVCMSGKPVFVMPGHPNGKYTLESHPTYFIAVTDHKEGTIITGDFVSSPKDVVFSGTTQVKMELDDTLTFI